MLLNRRFDIFRIAFYALILITPLFYGSFLVVPRTALELTAFFLLVLFIAKASLEPSSRIIYPGSSVLIVVFLLLCLFQCFPLPVQVVEMVSPKAASLYREYLIGPVSASPWTLSVYRFATLEELILLVAYMSVFFLAMNTFHDRKSFEKAIAILILWAGVLCFYGVVRKYAFPSSVSGVPFSTFGNRNHFAGYMTMVAPLSVGYAFTLRDRFQKLLFGFIGALIAATVFISLSRAGSLSVVFSFLTMAWLLRKEHKANEKYWIVALTLFATFLLVFLVGTGQLQERFALFQAGLSGRLRIARDSLLIVKDFPLFGVGLGNFRYVFDMYKRFSTTGQYVHLHNDHLQLVVEAGLLAAVFYFSFLFGLFREILGRLRDRRDPFVRNIVIGALSGLGGVFFHSVVEFNFHIPAVAFLFWFLLGLVYKCVYTHFSNDAAEIS